MLKGLQDGDNIQVALSLKAYKLPTGATNYLKVLEIPMADRLLGLSENIGFKTVYQLLVAAITVAMEALNLGKPLSAPQILEIADAIMDTAGEDQLSMEDVILFLQKLVRGELGKIYDRMDVPTFMERFEIHRDQRYKELKAYRREKDIHYKDLGAGRNGDFELKRDEDAGSILGLMQTLYDKSEE